MSQLFTGPRLFAAHLLLVAATLGSPYLSRFYNGIVPGRIVAQVGNAAPAGDDTQDDSPSARQKRIDNLCRSGDDSPSTREKRIDDLCHSSGYIHTNEAAVMMDGTLQDCASQVSASDIYLSVQGGTMSCANLADAYEQLNIHRVQGDQRIQLADDTTGEGRDIVQGRMMELSDLVAEYTQCITLLDNFADPSSPRESYQCSSPVPEPAADPSLVQRRSTTEDVGQLPVDLDGDGRYDTTVSGVPSYLHKMSGSVCPEVLNALRAGDRVRLNEAVKTYFIRKHEKDLEEGPKIFELGLSTLYDMVCPGAGQNFRPDFYQLLTGQNDDMVVRMTISKLSSSGQPSMSSAQ